MKTVCWFISILLTLCVMATAQDTAQSTKPESEQVFTVFDKTAGKYSMMFYRLQYEGRNYGGREPSMFYVLFLLPDRVHVLESRSLMGNWVDKFYANLPLDSFIVVEDSNGVFRLNDSVYVTAPPIDTAFETTYNGLSVHNAKTWDWERPGEWRDLPIVHGLELGGTYSSPGGIYKNYRIRQIRYYPASEIIIVFTEQPLLDQNKCTMNGLIISSLHPIGQEDY
jgi:hypothetical protein